MEVATECTTITDLGHALLGKVLAGKTGLHFSRASVGDGILPEGEGPEKLTALVQEVKDGAIAEIENPGAGEARISVQVSSLETPVGFFVKEIGVFATDPDEGEILYAYVSMPEKPQWIRPEGASISTLATFDIYAAVSRASSVTADICPSAMVSVARFNALKERVEFLEAETTLEVGSVTITNSQAYPFNTGSATVALKVPRLGMDYIVHTEVISTEGNIQSVEVYDKQLNGFKIRYDGSAASAEIKYYVSGGMHK